MGRLNKAVQTVPSKDDTPAELELNTNTVNGNKRALDVHQISSEEMRSVLGCLNKINDNLAKLVLMTAEMTDIDLEGE